MDASFFIAGRLRFKGNIAMICIAVSFLVMIIAVSVSSGFRHAIRSGLSDISGDIRITPPTLSVLDESLPIEADAAYRPYIEEVEGVSEIRPVVYKAGIVKSGDNIQGVLFKGMENDDTVSLAVSVPKRLAEIAGLQTGDRMLTYFVGESVKARQFTVTSVYDALVEADDKLVVYADISDLQRVNGWNASEVSCLEILLEDDMRNESDIESANDRIGTLINAYSSDDEESVIASSSVSSYPQLFDWLSLIDFNVLLILILMTIVAGFNMISGLLIMLFENISTIGLLKSLGMTDRAISKVFLSSSAILVAKGMLAGNALAIFFCIIQNTTKVLRLNPENYFVSFVPVKMDFGMILTADILAFVLIMLLLLIPCLFISKVDPADTVRVR
ncbi:MAG: ABC transporter permease [Bacteroidales bacterium]|nr:ABC transporter permease [Bacteroidales bacterium]